MPPANIDPREVRLRRRCTCNGGDVPRQSHATPNEGLLRGGLLDVPGVVGVFQSARDEKVAGIETWEPHDPAFVELIEKVRTVSSLPTHITEITTGGFYCEGET